MTAENLEKAKKAALVLLEGIKIEPNKKVPFVVNHPFFDSEVYWLYYSRNAKGCPQMINIFEGNNRELAVADVRKKIADADSFLHLYMLVNKPYHPTFFKLVADCDLLDGEEFTKYLIDVWTTTEFPNEDANVSISDWKRYFKKADKQHLMDKGEMCVYTYLPEKVTLYRGSHNGKPKRMSYTTNYAVALWFAKRFSKKGDIGYLIKTTVPKKAIYAYFNNGENECVINPSYIKEYEVEQIINDGNNEYPMFNEHN